MNKTLLTTAFAAATMAAQAISITTVPIIDPSSVPVGDVPVPTANTITFDEAAFGVAPANGVFNIFTGTEAVTVTVTPSAQIVAGSTVNITAQPFGGTAQYLTAGNTTVGTPVATFEYSTKYHTLSLLWGSVDSYNELDFFLNGALVTTVTGSQIIFPPNGNQGAGGTAFVTIGGLTFDKVALRSVGTYAFEVDNVTVPDGGATLALMGLGLVSIAAIRRKSVR